MPNMAYLILSLLTLLLTPGSAIDHFAAYPLSATAGLILTRSPSHEAYLTNITVAGQEITVIVDTGSSETWVATNATVCVGYNEALPVNESIWQVTCNFGPTVQIDVAQFNTTNTNTTFKARIYYGDGSFVAGEDSGQDVELDQLVVHNASLVLAEVVLMNGNGVSSGLLGLGFAPPATLTSTGDAKRVDDGGSDPGSTVAPAINNSPSSTPPTLASPILPTLFTQESLSQGLQMYTLSLSRDSSSSPSFGGFMTISSIPVLSDPHINITSSSPVASIRLENTTFLSPVPSHEYFAISVSAITALNNHTSGSSTSGSSSNGGGGGGGGGGDGDYIMILDAGTTLIYLNPSVAAGINAMFQPPASLTSDNTTYAVDCNAIPPEVQFHIGGQAFDIHPLDLIFDNGREGCVSAMVNAPNGRFILGDAFLRNVLALFDLGEMTVILAGREYYLF